MKKYEDKTKDQLINELIELSQRINALEKSENQLKQAEEALRESEKRFRELTELLPEIVFEMDIEGNFTFINQIGFDTFGYTQEDLDKGLNAFQLIVPEDRNKAKENLRKRQRGEDLGIVEYTMQRKDSSRFPVLIHASIVIDEEGKHVGLRGVAVNITERRRMEEVLRESEKRFRELVDLLPQTVFEIDEKGNFTFANAYGFKSSGYTQEDLDKGLNALQLFIPEDRDRVKENMRRILRGEKLGSNEYTALRKDGSTFPVIIYSSPIIRENRPVGLRGIVIDITSRKKTEEALRESEEKFRTLAEQSPNMIFINKKGRVIYANKKCEEIMGYKKDEFYSPNFDFFYLIAPESVEKVKLAFSKHKRGEEVEPYDYNLITKDGKRIAAIVTTRLINYEGDRAILGIVTDITERKKAEEALQRSELQYRTTIESMGDPIHVVDKDLRIILYNKALKQQTEELGLETEVTGQTVFEAFPFLHDKVRDEYLQVFNTGKILITEETTKVGGKEIITETRKIPVFDGEKVVRIVTVVRDITERKRAEEALKQRAEELEKSKAELQQSLQELLERVEREHGDLVTRPIPGIDIEEKGAIFLYPADREKEAYNLFRSEKDANRPALVITRIFPPRFQRKLGREVETVWLTSNRVPGMVCVDPSDTMNLILVLSEFFKRAPGGMILFEGVEYVISIAGFERFLHIVQLLNDKIAMTEGTIYMILALDVLEEKEARHILRECLTPPEGIKAKEEVKALGNEG